LIEKPGTGIFLMKENAKVTKKRRIFKTPNLSKRLSQIKASNPTMNIDEGSGSKRKNLGKNINNS
jgi:hypothetical protein